MADDGDGEPIVEQSVMPWDQQEGEDDNWYLKFERYYLLKGLARSIRGATAYFMRETNPEQYERRKNDKTLSMQWYAIADQYDWYPRALAYDRWMNQQLRKEVENTIRKMMELTPDAVAALQQALSSPRLGVAAAKEILDRGGVPAKSIHEIEQRTTVITSDDLAKAKEDAEKWARENFGESG